MENQAGRLKIWGAGALWPEAVLQTCKSATPIPSEIGKDNQWTSSLNSIGGCRYSAGEPSNQVHISNLQTLPDLVIQDSAGPVFCEYKRSLNIDWASLAPTNPSHARFLR